MHPASAFDDENTPVVWIRLSCAAAVKKKSLDAFYDGKEQAKVPFKIVLGKWHVQICEKSCEGPANLSDIPRYDKCIQ